MFTVLETDFFHRWKLQEKSTFVYIDFYTLLKMYCYAKQCQFTTIVDLLFRITTCLFLLTFMLCYCL